VGELIHPGRRVWIRIAAGRDFGETVKELVVTKFKQFLPKGPTAVGDPPSYDGHRERDLIQFWSDHGLRTVAVAEVLLTDPRKKKK
jgi:hypothetical protein